MSSYLLYILIFTPLVTLYILLLPSVPKSIYKYLNQGSALVQLLVSICIFIQFQPDSITDFQFGENLQWIQVSLGTFGSLAINYNLGVDGLSVSMILLAGIVLSIGA